MNKQLIIVGGGHAGSSAALAAARQSKELNVDIDITLIDPNDCLTVRPRLYEYELEETLVPLKNFLSPLNIKVIKNSVEQVNFNEQTVILKNKKKLKFDSLILAAGSEIAQPPIPGLALIHNIDNYTSALKFREAFKQRTLNSIEISVAVMGSGLTGIELACELSTTLEKMTGHMQKPKLTVYLIDRHDCSENLGPAPKPYLQQAFKDTGVTCINHATINKIDEQGIHYNDTEFLKADLIVSTLGLRANKLSQSLNLPCTTQGRIEVNQHLQISSHASCFAAGDFALCKADDVHDSVMSCQQGRPQGRYAGFNAVNFLFGNPLITYSQPNYVTCVDLGAAGALFTEGWQRKVKSSGQEAKKIKRHINCDRIYPPKDLSIDSLLAAGEVEFITPTDSLNQKES